MPSPFLISIIMPAFNAQKFLSESIASVIAQTYTNWELIIIDDGSTDKTKKIIELFCEKDHRIQYIFQPNGKQGKARNTGINNSKGSYIAFLDADDFWLKDKLEKQVKLLEVTGADLIFSDIAIIDEYGNQIKASNGIIDEQFKDENGLRSFLKSNNIPLLTVLARKEAIEISGSFDESNTIQYGEDYFLWLRMLLNGFTFISTAEILAKYRKHPHQSIANTPAKSLQIIEKMHQLVVPENLKKDKAQAMNTWIHRYLSVKKDITKQQLQNTIQFIPSPIFSKLADFLLTLLPTRIIAAIIKFRFYLKA